jgi:hypothetical protein
MVTKARTECAGPLDCSRRAWCQAFVLHKLEYRAKMARKPRIRGRSRTRNKAICWRKKWNDNAIREHDVGTMRKRLTMKQVMEI